jgi:hypothetical protein
MKMHSTTTAAATTRDSTAADGPDAFSTPREMGNGHYKSGELLEGNYQYLHSYKAYHTTCPVFFFFHKAQTYPAN